MKNRRPSFVLGISFSLCVIATALRAAPPAEKPPAPLDWSLRVYRFPAPDLGEGFVSPERGQLHAPAMPTAEAKEEDVANFLRYSTEVVTQYLKLQGILVPKGTLFAYDPVNSTLAARTMNEVHEQLIPLSIFYVDRVPHYLNFDIQMFEASAADMRHAVDATAGKADHTAILATLNELADKGQARRLGSSHLVTRSGQRALVERLQKGAHATGMSVDKNGRLNIPMEEHSSGTRLEIDPVLGPDGITIDLNFSFDHDFAPPTERWEPFVQNGTRTLETRVTDYHMARITTAITVVTGMTKLMGVCKPDATADQPDRADAWQAAFLKGDVVPVLPLLSDRAEQLIVAYGEKVEPQPKAGTVPSATPPNLPKGMILRRFRVPPDFLSSAGQGGAGGAPAASDPFAAPVAPKNEPRITVRMTALDILKSLGIEFPIGASANFNAFTSELIVRNTPKNMEILASYLDQLEKVPQCIGIRLYIVQGDAALIRRLSAEAATTADHLPELHAVEAAAAEGKAKILRTVWLETRSGQRASVEFGQLHMRAGAPEIRNLGGESSSAPAAPEPKANNSNVAPAKPSSSSASAKPFITVQAVDHESSRVGTGMEIDPVLGPDGQTLDLNFTVDYDYAPPSQRHPLATGDAKTLQGDAPVTDFHQAKVASAITLLSGMVQMVGVWKPEGSPEFQAGDVLQAAFISGSVLKVQP